MEFNRVWLRIMQRRFGRWLQSLFAPTPVKRTVTVPEYNGWTSTQKRLEEESYLANPHAVWLKPDRFESRLWMEGVWARLEAEPLQPSSFGNTQTSFATGWQQDQLAAARYQNAANHRVMLMQLQQYNQLSSFQQQARNGLNSPFSNLLGPLL